MSRFYQKEILLKHLNDKRDWVFNYDLEGVKTEYGWLGSQADRRARELAGKVGRNPEFEYRGEYRGIEYVIKGRIVCRCRQYRAEIIGGVYQAPEAKQVEAKAEEMKQEDNRCVCDRCHKAGFVAKFGDGMYCKECIDYIAKYGNNF